MTEALTTHAAAQLVPAGYAEKAMASLMQLHGELMDEKERRVELFRKLMEREQALAELKMYVKVLEERMAASAPQPQPQAQPAVVAPPAVAPLTVEAPRPVQATARVTPSRVPPIPPAIAPRPRPDGWKTW